jgi:TIR domain
MGQSVLVFISHSSEDKEKIIEPVVSDLEDCYINTWLDKRKILPGDNLRKSIFREGLDKADVALIFFTKNSLKSSWVDKEIKHVLREESKKGNNFDLNKIISIFDSTETYNEIAKRYPELTDDLLHLMPENYSKVQLGQLVSAIWSKYFQLQGGDIATQKQLLGKDKELFQKDKDIELLKRQLIDIKSKEPSNNEFETYLTSGKITSFLEDGQKMITNGAIEKASIKDLKEVLVFGLVERLPNNMSYLRLTKKGIDFFKWFILSQPSKFSDKLE